MKIPLEKREWEIEDGVHGGGPTSTSDREESPSPKFLVS